MHNWLIFQYHHVRVHSDLRLLRGCRNPSGFDEPTHLCKESNEGTQEGK